MQLSRAPDAAPDAAPDGAPDAAPDVASDAAPDAAPDAATLLHVRCWMLSCRSLHLGIEHRMMRHLAALAAARCGC